MASLCQVGFVCRIIFPLFLQFVEGLGWVQNTQDSFVGIPTVGLMVGMVFSGSLSLNQTNSGGSVGLVFILFYEQMGLDWVSRMVFFSLCVFFIFSHTLLAFLLLLGFRFWGMDPCTSLLNKLSVILIQIINTQPLEPPPHFQLIYGQ